MKTTRKILSLLTALCLLVSALTACSAPEEIAEETSEVSAEEVAETVTEDPEEIDPLTLLPEADYGGASIHILGDVNSNWWIISLDSEELTGEIINDTVFARNTFVEDKYNVAISKTDTQNVTGDLDKSVKAGTDEYQMVWERINALLPIAERGDLLDLNGFDNFSMDPRWWDKNAEEAFTINKRLFFGCNDINVHTVEGCSAMYFSKTLVTTHTLDNPYDLVREKTWTLDKMGEMMRAVANDTNGDGERNEGDTFGLITGIGQYLSLVNGAGARLVYLDESEGSTAFTLNIVSEEVIAQTEVVSALVNDKNLSVIVNDDGWGYNAFYTDHSLFYIMQLGSIVGLRDNMETDFGVLPFPMRDTSQDVYMTSMEATAQAVCYPQTITDKEMVGNVTEAMAIYSDQHLTDAYYETTLKGKIARDQDTTEMLDLLTAVRIFDYATCYGSWNVYNSYLTSVRANGAEELSSVAAKMQKTFAKQQQKAFDALAGLQQ